jgi:DNA polymerase-3 subunit beta
MKLIIGRDALAEPLHAVANVVEKRQTLPILANVLVNAVDNAVTFTATDMEVEIQVRIDHKAQSKGGVTLPARKLVDICRALPPDATIELETSGDKVSIKSGRSRFSLMTMASDEFPSLGDIEGKVAFQVPATELRELIEQTQFAMAHQDVRYYLNGMLLEVHKDSLKAVATDGHRLAMCEKRMKFDIAETVQIVIPRKGVTELAKILGDSENEVSVAVNDNHIQVTTTDKRFISKLIDGRFPDYERVLPQNTSKVVEADRETLRQGLARTSILSNEKFRGVRLSLSTDQLRALAHNPEQEEAEEEMEVSYDGPELEIGFNVSYLLDVLNVIKNDSVNLHLSDANSSCLIQGKGDEYGRYVVMPMRL